jgi:hypothetical protein
LPKSECFFVALSLSIAPAPLTTDPKEINMWITTNVRKTLFVEGIGIPKRLVCVSIMIERSLHKNMKALFARPIKETEVLNYPV